MAGAEYSAVCRVLIGAVYPSLWPPAGPDPAGIIFGLSLDFQVVFVQATPAHRAGGDGAGDAVVNAEGGDDGVGRPAGELR